MKQIIIDVLEDGEIRIQTTGFTGKSCVEETKFLEALLGKQISRQLTPAYYAENEKTVKKHIPLCG
jgi:hypothetical protein